MTLPIWRIRITTDHDSSPIYTLMDSYRVLSRVYTLFVIIRTELVRTSFWKRIDVLNRRLIRRFLDFIRGRTKKCNRYRKRLYRKYNIVATLLLRIQIQQMNVYSRYWASTPIAWVEIALRPSPDSGRRKNLRC